MFVPHSRLLLRELPESEQPIPRLVRWGGSSLSLAELLEIIIGAPEALGREILTQFTLGELGQASVRELEALPGIGRARAARILAAIELGRRLLRALDDPDVRPRVANPGAVAQLLMSEMSGLQQEELWVILLNTRNRVLDLVMVYRGSLWACAVRPADLFREAVRQSAAAVIIAHNHSSGDPSPSPEDIQLTCQLVEAGRVLGISVLDHLVIGRGRYISMGERKLVPGLGHIQGGERI